MKSPRLLILLVAAGSLVAGTSRDWKTGIVRWAATVPYNATDLQAGDARSRTHSDARAEFRPGDLFAFIAQWQQFSGDTEYITVSGVLGLHGPKLTVNRPIQYALGKHGKIYIRDEDNRQFKLSIITRVPQPLGARATTQLHPAALASR
jgi:hypothetical protein